MRKEQWTYEIFLFTFSCEIGAINIFCHFKFQNSLDNWFCGFLNNFFSRLSLLFGIRLRLTRAFVVRKISKLMKLWICCTSKQRIWNKLKAVKSEISKINILFVRQRISNRKNFFHQKLSIQYSLFIKQNWIFHKLRTCLAGCQFPIGCVEAILSEKLQSSTTQTFFQCYNWMVFVVVATIAKLLTKPISHSHSWFLHPKLKL